MVRRAVTALAVLMASTAAVQAAEQTSRHMASVLTLKDVSAEVHVSTEADRVVITRKGPDAWVKALEVTETGAGVVVDGRRAATMAGGGSNVSVNASNVTATAIGGGVASVTIGDQTVTSGGPPRQLLIQMPAGTAFSIDGGALSCSVGPLKSGVTVRLDAGDCRFDSLSGNDRLTIDGGGSIEVGRAVGSLAATIQGSGQVSVQQARLSSLKAAIPGNGQITVEGRAEQADLSLTGAGMIQVDEVGQRPRVTSNGAGAVMVGNWP